MDEIVANDLFYSLNMLRIVWLDEILDFNTEFNLKCEVKL